MVFQPVCRLMYKLIMCNPFEVLKKRISHGLVMPLNMIFLTREDYTHPWKPRVLPRSFSRVRSTVQRVMKRQVRKDWSPG